MMEVKLNLKMEKRTSEHTTEIHETGRSSRRTILRPAYVSVKQLRLQYSTGLNEPGEYKCKDYLNPARLLLCKKLCASAVAELKVVIFILAYRAKIGFLNHG